MTKTPLTVHNAEIRTATVEIKTLTVSGKQVTLAVFRQLIEEPLLDVHSQPRGVMWGTVNYHPDKCGDDPEHLHVVWQQGPDLRRSALYAPDTAYLRSPSARAVMEAAIRDGLRGERPGTFTAGLGLTRVWVGHAGPKPIRNGHARSLLGAQFVYGGVSFESRISEGAAWIFNGNDAHWSQAASWPAEAADLPPLADLLPRLHADSYKDLWHLAQALPQLFIAV